MRILHIHIKNINSLKGEFNIDLASGALLYAGIFAITGATGAGKTTILDAITLALYGKVARNKDVKEVLSHGTAEGHAEVIFQVFDKKYLASWQIRRARGKTDGKIMNPKRELALWDENANAYQAIAEKIREVDLAVEKISGLDYHRFTRSVLLSQGDFAAFLRADERERSDLLERITGTEIYSQLSIAAFERYREEKQTLESLQSQLEQLGLFSEEAVDEDQLAIAKKEAKERELEQKGQREKLQIFDRWHEAKEKQLELDKEHVQVEADILAFQAKAFLLKQSKILRPYSADIDKILDWNQQLADLTIEKQQLEEQLLIHSDKEKEQQLALSKLNKNKLVFQKEKAIKEQIFHKVDKINDQLELLKQEQTVLNTKQERIKSVLADKEKAAKTLEDKLAVLKNKLNDAEKWLKNNQQYADLQNTLPALEALRDQLRTIYKNKKSASENSAEKQLINEQQQEQLKTLRASLKKEQDVLDGLENNYQKNLPEDFYDIEHPGKQLALKIDELKENIQSFKQLIGLEEDYNALLKEQQAHEDQLESLAIKQQNTSVELLNLLEQSAHFQEELTFKKAIYQQQQLMANYEQDRQYLKEGEACPLCLSTDHPFHKHPVKPYVDKAKEEAEKAEIYAEKLQKQERILLQQENELNKEIELLKGNEIKSTSGRLEAHRQKLERYEERMAKVLKGKSIEWGKRGKFLAQKVLEEKTIVKKWQQLQLQLETLVAKITVSKGKIEKIDRNLITLQSEIKTNESLLFEWNKTKQEQADKFLELSQQLNRQTIKYDYQFSLETARDAFLNFKSKAADYQQWQQTKVESKQEISENEIHFSHFGKEINQLQKELKVLEEAKTVAEQQNETLQAKITTLLNGQRLDLAREKLQKSELDLENKLNKTRNNHQETAKRVVVLKQRLKDKTAQLFKLKSAYDELNTSLLKKLLSLKYTSIEAAKAVILSPEKEEKLTQQSIHYNNKRIESKRALKEIQKELKKWTPSDEEQENEAAFRANYDVLNEAYQKSLFKHGQLEEKYTQQQKKKQQHTQLLEKIEQQRLSFNRWAQLNELIGQADGKKFRTYAQGLTLQKLVAIANQYLEKLNGRYFIHKKTDADLELEIIDTYQADNRRSMYTLSGGETFLISLALAMGLSELAGKNAQIHSLFIDEGFGTLDAQSLDLALSTLENLQSEGKTIGIISHLKELKERIGVQIQVHKQSNGFSTLSIRS